MASIRKLDSGHYQVRWRDQSGRSHSETCRKKANATLKKHEIEHKLDTGGRVDPKAGRTTLNQWIDEAWELSQQVTPRTAMDRRSRYQRYIAPTFGDISLDRIDRMAIQKWVNQLSKTALAPATIKKIYETLSSPLKTATNYGYLNRSPCSDINLPAISKKEMRFLTVEEVNDLANTITPRFELLIRFLAETGLRIGEAAGLQGHDYQPVTRTLSVKRQLLKAAFPPVYGDPKTKAGIRSLKLSASLGARIEALNVVGEEPIFTSLKGSFLNQENLRRRHFIPAAKTSGIGHLRIHDLRHTAISLWIYNQADIKVVTQRAGIVSAAVALDRYGHCYPNADPELANRLEAAIYT